MFCQLFVLLLSIIPCIFAQLNETETPSQFNETETPLDSTNAPELLFISSIPFKDYEAFCPDDGPVTVFQYKPIRLENERDGLLFNVTEWPSEDYLLKASCFDLKKFFGNEMANLSSPQCRLGEAFAAGQTVWDNDPTHMCKKGEYVNGASSEYVNGSRMIKVRCCQLDEFQQANGFDCFDVPSDQRYAHMFLNQRRNCAVDVLQALTISRGDDWNVGVKTRYCGFERKGFEADPFCAVKRRIEMKQALTRSLPTPEEEEVPIDISLEGGVGPGEKTPIDGTFDFACPKSQAVSRVDVEEVIVGQLAFTFDCANVSAEPQRDQEIRYTSYVAFPESDDPASGCDYHSNEVLCAVKSYISPKESLRLYSFGCCQMSNLGVIDSQDEELRYSDLINGHLDNPASAKGQFLHRFRMEKAPTGNGSSLVTAWSAYNYVNRGVPIRVQPRRAAGVGKMSATFYVVLAMAILAVCHRRG